MYWFPVVKFEILTLVKMSTRRHFGKTSRKHGNFSVKVLYLFILDSSKVEILDFTKKKESAGYLQSRPLLC